MIVLYCFIIAVLIVVTFAIIVISLFMIGCIIADIRYKRTIKLYDCIIIIGGIACDCIMIMFTYNYIDLCLSNM